MAAQRGDRQAFEALWCAQEPLLRDFLAQRVSPHVLDTVLQQVRLAAWSALPQYRHRPRFRAWIFTLASRKSGSYPRPNARRESTAQAENADPYKLSSPDEAGAKSGKIDPAMLAQLPAEQRDVLDLYYGADLTLKEIAQILSRKPDTVKHQFYRAHARMAENGVNSRGAWLPVSPVCKV